ncbi:MAG: aminoacyl-histidine dipeptidase [Spirochaetales bacterium]|nr:aminoacyl-histidine dipeptidase [Spirochaetales bacterium]
MTSSTQRVLDIFNEMNRVPRQSGHLEKIHPWLMEWGQNHGFEVLTDDSLNVIIRVPGSAGKEDAPPVVLQGHMDMVCEKERGVEHDFQNDPVISKQEGDWLKAEGTSLGADNGIAIAMAFDVATNPDIPHPPLEILITSDEETGLVGAQGLAPGVLQGQTLLNLDSEDDGVFTVGCAGGVDTYMRFPLERSPLSPQQKVYQLEVGGLEGGHSGVEIHLGKANALVLLFRALDELLRPFPHLRMTAFHGGTAHNAIPRDASALIAVSESDVDALKNFVAQLENVFATENSAIEKRLFMTLTERSVSNRDFYTTESAQKLLDIVRQVPHGVRGMSSVFEGMVETSMNLAVIRDEENQLLVNTSQRSARVSRLEELTDGLASLTRLGGGSFEKANQYPPWEPSASSPILEKSQALWKKLYNQEPVVEVIHAGLECGIIGTKYPGMDMISMGPTIVQPHSPDERMSLSSLERTYAFLLELLKEL